jgi:SAM-dependent methyltransferase
MPFAHTSDQLDPYVAALCPEIVTSGVDLTVDTEDEMFRLFLHRHWHHGSALSSYFRSGHLLWSTLRSALTWRFGDLHRVTRLLDFAAGYGRVTRFIARDLPADRVWAADIDPRAVSFQMQRFGVRGLVSTASPDDLPAADPFDAVLVSSLFTHLPEATFGRWLARLWTLVAPRGLLAFSVHDPSLRPDAAAGASGGAFLFEATSEDRTLPAADYGSTWAGEPYVRRTLAAAAPGAAVHRFPRALCNYQDLYLVVDGPAPDPAALDLGGRPEGFVETCRLLGARRLALQGWAVDRMDGAPIARVEALLDGAVAAVCPEPVLRPDIAPLFPGERLEPVGWSLRLDLPAGTPLAATSLVVRATDPAGRTGILAEGTVETALLRAARLDFLATGAELDRTRADLQAKIDEQSLSHAHDLSVLRARISAMEASRFWKLRDRWFALKRLLTGQP